MLLSEVAQFVHETVTRSFEHQLELLGYKEFQKIEIRRRAVEFTPIIVFVNNFIQNKSTLKPQPYVASNLS